MFLPLLSTLHERRSGFWLAIEQNVGTLEVQISQSYRTNCIDL
jgi:hypothetical protein